MLSNTHQDDFLALLQQCFSGYSIDNGQSLDELQAKLKDAYMAFDGELRFNLLNVTTSNPRVLLEAAYAGLEQYSSSMIRDSSIVDNLFIAKGWEPAGIVYDNPVWSEARFAQVEADFISGRSLSRIQKGFDIGQPVEELFATLTPTEIQTVRRGLASAYVKKAWEGINHIYKRYGGIAREVPREGGEMIVVSIPVLQDLRRYVPGMRYLSVIACPTEAHAFEEWARYLNNLRWWNYPFSQPWPAPIEYEQAFHESPNRGEFLSGLRRLLDAAEPVLSIPDEDNPLFREDNQPLSKELREEIRLRGLHRARIVAKRIGQWVQLRQKPASEQLMQALERVLLVPEWNDTGESTRVLTVACPHTDDDVTLHFSMLLARFREDIPESIHTLNTIHSRLTQFLDASVNALAGDSFENGVSTCSFKKLYTNLIEVMPHLNFVDGVKDITEEPITQVTDNFREKLSNSIVDRRPWALRALTLVQSALGMGNIRNSGLRAGDPESKASLLLDAYVQSGFTRQAVDSFLLEKGLLKQAEGSLVANQNYKPRHWAAVRCALEKCGIISPVSNQVAADVFAKTYSVKAVKNSFNYTPAPLNQKNTWAEKDVFYYGLVASLEQGFLR